MLGTKFDLRPSLADDPGPSFELDTIRKPTTKITRIRESRKSLPPDTESSFDDTFRLREAAMYPDQDKPRGEKGIPIEDKSTSKNYTSQIIDGEHKSLTVLGKINEAMEDDDHDGHMLKHRIQLASGDLTETQRANLMSHLESHVKAKGKKLKTVKAAAEAQNGNSRDDITGAAKYKKGFGQRSRALPATQYDVIPQSSDVDQERKKTQGIVSMESRESKFRRFRQAARRSL